MPILLASERSRGILTPYRSTNDAGLLLPEAMSLASLQLWLRRDVPGTGATWTDSSAQGNDGAITNATWTTGDGSNVLDCDGSGDYVDVGNDSALSDMSHLTFAVRCNLDSIPGGESVLIGRGYNGVHAHMCLGNLNTVWTGLGMGFYDGSSWHYVSPGSSLSTGVWHTVVGTYDGTTGKVYVDGVEVASATLGSYSGGGNTQSTLIMGGVWSGSPSRYSDGQVAWAAIWSTALTADQVAGLSGL